MPDDRKHDPIRKAQVKPVARSAGERAGAKAAESGTDRTKRPDADDGPLESIGKAVSSPLLGSEEAERAKEAPAGARKPRR